MVFLFLLSRDTTRKKKDDTSHRIGLWAPGLSPADPGVPGFVSLDSPFLHSDVDENLAKVAPGAKVVVYAGALKALCAVSGLLDRGVAPGRITLVRPLPPGVVAGAPGVITQAEALPKATVAPMYAAAVGAAAGRQGLWSLGDVSVDVALAAAVAEAGVKDGGDRLLEGVSLNAEGGVSAVNFADLGAISGGGRHSDVSGEDNRPMSTPQGAKKGGRYTPGGAPGRGNLEEEDEEEDTEGGKTGQRVSLECGMLLCGDTPNVDPDVFRAVNNSGLVYDGRLVVDPMFRTSDPAILAGGTLTKYSRVHGLGAPRHEKYNAREVR